MRRVLLVGLAVAMLTACAETTSVHTQPPGAALWVNDVFVGKTPVEYGVSSAEFDKQQHYRLELAGFRTREGDLEKRVKPARIVGGCFSLGVSLLFKGPRAFRDQHRFVLSPLPPVDEPAQPHP